MNLGEDQVTLLAHLLGGMGGNISAGNPAFQGVPQSLVQASNFARLLNALGGKTGNVASTTQPSGTAARTDNNPNTPPQRMKLSMDGVPGDLTQALTNMYFGGIGGGVTIPNWPPLRADEASIPSPFDKRSKEVAGLSSALGGVAPPF